MKNNQISQFFVLAIKTQEGENEVDLCVAEGFSFAARFRILLPAAEKSDAL